MNETWTPADDDRLAEMQARKQRVQKARMDPLAALVGEDMPHIRQHMANDIAEWMAQHADTLRDLLQPFDSGVRAAPVKSLTDLL